VRVLDDEQPVGTVAGAADERRRLQAGDDLRRGQLRPVDRRVRRVTRDERGEAKDQR